MTVEGTITAESTATVLNFFRFLKKDITVKVQQQHLHGQSLAKSQKYIRNFIEKKIRV